MVNILYSLTNWMLDSNFKWFKMIENDKSKEDIYRFGHRHRERGELTLYLVCA